MAAAQALTDYAITIEYCLFIRWPKSLPDRNDPFVCFFERWHTVYCSAGVVVGFLTAMEGGWETGQPVKRQSAMLRG